MRLLLIMRLLLFTIGLKLSRGYYNRGGYYPSAVTITGNTVLWLNPLMGEELYSLVDGLLKIILKKEYWNYMQMQIHGIFWIKLWKMEEGGML